MYGSTKIDPVVVSMHCVAQHVKTPAIEKTLSHKHKMGEKTLLL